MPAAVDKRFAADAWQAPPFAYLAGYYLALEAELQGLAAGVPGVDGQRLQWTLENLLPLWDPRNYPWTNPAVIQRTFETGGMNWAIWGLRAWSDLFTGRLTVVDKTAFTVGENIAATPGRVVWRNELIELIEYTPVTPQIHQRPVLVVPPEINRYYIMDLAPGRSFVEYAVAQGLHTFMIVWRNPRREHAQCGLDQYVQSLLEAADATLELTGADAVNPVGVCAGGQTLAAALAYMAQTGDHRVAAPTWMVTQTTAFDTPGILSMVRDPWFIDWAKAAIQLSGGIVRGSAMGNMFSQLRPDQLLAGPHRLNMMGLPLPADPLMFWNSDATDMTGALNADFMDIVMNDGFVTGVPLLGRTVFASDIHLPSFHIAGGTDHITPYPACFAGARLISGPARFVITGTGHVQTLTSAPGTRVKPYRVFDLTAAGLDDSLAASNTVDGSWYPEWYQWLSGGGHAGDLVPAPVHTDAALGTAPGTYVFDA